MRIIRRLLLGSFNHGFGAVYAVQAASASLKDLGNLKIEDAVCERENFQFVSDALFESVLFWAEEKNSPPQPMSRITSSFWGSSHWTIFVASLGTKEAAD